MGLIILRFLCAPGAQTIAAPTTAWEAIMRKWVLVVGLAALALATAALAGDPWKQKKAEEWKEEEVRRILNDSPWSRPYEIPVLPSPMMGQASGGGNDMTNNAAIGATGGGGGGGRGRSRGNNINPDTQPGRQIVYLAQWYSSRTLRAAQIRAAELAGSVVPKENALFKVPEN